jgi:hypothetical protein
MTTASIAAAWCTIAEYSSVCPSARGHFSSSHSRTLDMGHAADRVRGDRILCAIVEAIGLA